MEINTAQAAKIGRLAVGHRSAIDKGRPWTGGGPLNEDTLRAVANGAANTYDLSKLVTELDRADSSVDFLRELLAVAFAHGFVTATALNSASEGLAGE
ncbi:hypothetical protein [Streptomyces olivaceus]|uniref:hypothetical protein n=1 Tax=Streptomyces olivaceus TaxID=47716 RepID=UPI0036E078C4